jgi:dTDP-4-amino-4,6-dideoxygalactose transaminase
MLGPEGARRRHAGTEFAKPHEQLASAPVLGGDVAADLFDRGLCLPSGSTLSEVEQDEVTERVRGCLGQGS